MDPLLTEGGYIVWNFSLLAGNSVMYDDDV